MGKEGESGENIGKQGESGKNIEIHDENRANKGKTQKNM